MVVEEHQIQGGLGGAVAEVLADACLAPKRFLRLAVGIMLRKYVGKVEHFLATGAAMVLFAMLKPRFDPPRSAAASERPAMCS